MKEVSEALNPCESRESVKKHVAAVKVVPLSLISFALGIFAFLAEYAVTGRSFQLSILAGSVSNLVWGLIFLLVIRWFTPEPYLRIAFYSFIMPTLLFAIPAAFSLLPGHPR